MPFFNLILATYSAACNRKEIEPQFRQAKLILKKITLSL